MSARNDGPRRANHLEGFPSGQRDQTVNLPALPSKVRILPPPPLPFFFSGNITFFMRASYNGYYPSLPSLRYGFDSRCPLQNVLTSTL